jgi:hypothetical protein
MPKQVRLRRGTTAQHATFVGADGEVTFDTTKKALVLHDGVTPGGKPLEGFLVLDPGNPLLVQEIESSVSITGGDSDSFGLIVTQQARFDAIITAQAGIYPRRIHMQHEAIVYAPSVNLDFNGVAHKRVALGGDLSLTATNMDYGKSLLLRIAADGSVRALSFPAGWKFVGAAAPASIAANKTALLRLDCFGVNEADVVARYLVEP